MVLFSMRLVSLIIQNNFIVCQNVLCTDIFGVDFEKCFWVGELCLHEDHKLLTYSVTATKQIAFQSADCIDIWQLSESKYLYLHKR